ncbi:hypothetical protein [Kitasatospora albolonga]|uniref:hypothetical protein n=1 Tax=Kitasatospora albolonga TaxID=68173 RepID=UPI0031ED1D4F
MEVVLAQRGGELLRVLPRLVPPHRRRPAVRVLRVGRVTELAVQLLGRHRGTGR